MTSPFLAPGVQFAKMEERPRSIKTEEQLVDYLLANAYRKGSCLISHLSPNKKGYVPVQFGGRKGKKWRVHRLVYHVKCEPITADDQVLHHCDNRRCIEQEHLYKGTPAQNTADMMNRSRGANQHRTGYNWRSR